jgi:hypothetical protein
MRLLSLLIPLFFYFFCTFYTSKELKLQRFIRVEVYLGLDIYSFWDIKSVFLKGENVFRDVIQK